MKRMTTAVLASAALLCLSACTADTDDAGSGTGPTVQETPMPMLTIPPSAAAKDPTMSLNAVPSKPMSAEEARQHERDCVMAAAGLASIALAPSAFIYGTDSEKLSELEAQLEDMENQVPAELKSHITELEAVVHKNLADPQDFHSEEFRRASQPIELWVREHCRG